MLCSDLLGYKFALIYVGVILMLNLNKNKNKKILQPKGPTQSKWVGSNPRLWWVVLGWNFFNSTMVGRIEKALNPTYAHP